MAKFLCLGVSLYFNAVGEMAWPTKATLAERMGLDEDKVDRALGLAKDAGYLRFINRGPDGACYYPCFPDERKFWGDREPDNEGKVVYRVTPDQALKINEILFGGDPLVHQAIVVMCKGA